MTAVQPHSGRATCLKVLHSCKVVDISCLWDDVTYHVWLPTNDSVIRATPDQFAEVGHPERIRYILYAARIARM
ncbi:MAG TPA: hypothetical protein VGK48_26610 [Terriglobia bacterium]|jgi:hypothetical protein